MITMGKHPIQEHSTLSYKSAFYYEKLFKTSLNLKKDRIDTPKKSFWNKTYKTWVIRETNTPLSSTF